LTWADLVSEKGEESWKKLCRNVHSEKICILHANSSAL